MPITEPLINITEGWTKALRFLLTVNGQPTNLTGLTISLVLRRQSGDVVSPGGTIAILDQDTNLGELEYSPVAADFVWETNLFTITQAYKLHWKAVDGGGKVVFFPSGLPAEIAVHRA